MSSLPEFVGTVHIIFGPYRGNPIALYLMQSHEGFHISPRVYPWNCIVGTGETINKAAANFEEKWKHNELAPEMYTGPHWEGGVKPEKPKPPPKPAIAKPTATVAPSTTVASTIPSPQPEVVQNVQTVDVLPPEKAMPPAPDQGAG